MLEYGKLENLNEYFLPLSKRKRKVFFSYRIVSINDSTEQFISEYIENARSNGLLLEGGIKNPDTSNVEFCINILGRDFQLSPAFFESKIKKLVCQIDATRARKLSELFYDYFYGLIRSGTSKELVYNLYIKFMSWLYCKFSMLISQLGTEKLPKILIWGKTAKHELVFLNIISKLGADLLYIFPKGDKEYLRFDVESVYSNLYTSDDQKPFKSDLSLKELIENSLYKDCDNNTNNQILGNLNTWVDDSLFNHNSVLIKCDLRKKSSETSFCNIFYIQYGVDDKYTYSATLSDFYKKLVGAKRKIYICDGGLNNCSPEEVNSIERGNYANLKQLAIGLSKNLKFPKNKTLEALIIKSFIETINKECMEYSNNLSKVIGIAVKVICWIKGIYSEVLSELKIPECGVFIYYNLNEPKVAEKVFLSLISKLPIDIVCFFPNSKDDYSISEKAYKTVKNEVFRLEYFPINENGLRETTFAGAAESEINNALNNDGIKFGLHQFKKGTVVTLNTSTHEINLLWDNELRYRPGFNSDENEVFMPVLFAKINGVGGGELGLRNYWFSIKKLLTKQTTLITQFPWLSEEQGRLIAGNATRYIDVNKRINKSEIMRSSLYKYTSLNLEKQEYLLDKLQKFISSDLLENPNLGGIENLILGTLLDLPEKIYMDLQTFDFTKKNPKYMFISTDKYIFTLKETIVIHFLNYLGFDVLIYTPTGFECFGNVVKRIEYNTFNIGEYVFNAEIPDFDNLNRTFFEKISNLFKK